MPSPDSPPSIKPQAVPLTHRGDTRRSGPRRRALLPIGLVVLILAGALIALLRLPDQAAPRIAKTPQPTAPEPTTTRPAPEAQPAPGLPPYQALRREQARVQANQALARFVEIEAQFNETLHPGAWAEAGYAQATGFAEAGDKAFLLDAFDEALQHYGEAAEQLAALIASGEQQFADALIAATRALDARKAANAAPHLELARSIKPDAPELLAADTRAEAVPDLVNQFREARNHELAGRWQAAESAYRSIQRLDGRTVGIGEAIARARRGAAEQTLNGLLSNGYAALAEQRFDAARRAFEQARKLDPNNPSAAGGLQQVAEQSVLTRIDKLRQKARDFETAENWSGAAQAYSEILALDDAIQFARLDLQAANRQRETLAALQRLLAEPDRLSSDASYAAARQLLADAGALAPQGPILARALEETARLLELYGQPVAVTLRSDDATDVLLSQIGPLGRFSEKQLRLRPGAYTLIGSRDGCRDRREEIRVRAGMAPIDIRCQELLQR